MITRKERLMRILRGESTDRPAVSFYEIGGFSINPQDKDEYNIYNSPSWQPLLKLADEETDIIRMVSPVRAQSHISWDGTGASDLRQRYIEETKWEEGNSRFTRFTYHIDGKKLTSVTRRDKEVDTVWVTEPLLKNADDARLFLKLPDELFEESLKTDHVIEEEQKLGTKGIVMIDTEDPVCAVAGLFDMETFTIFALTEQALCHDLLRKHAIYIHKRAEMAARMLPGRLWRIYGPEYVTEPFLPPELFNDYVVKYTGPMVEHIKKHGGIARIHSHGRIRNVLDYIAGMGADGIDPIEPPPHGDIDLKEVRQKYGRQLVLFGNIEISYIENMEKDDFRKLVRNTIIEGTYGKGRGFILMPTSSPYGRTISDQVLTNYKIMIEEVTRHKS